MHPNKPLSTFFLIIVSVLFAVAANAQIQPKALPMETAVEGFLVPPGSFNDNDEQAVLLTVTLDMEPDWYTYSNLPMELGKPTRLTGTTSDGKSLTIIYPKGKDKPDPFDPATTIKAFPSGTQLFALVPGGVENSMPVTLKLDLLLCHPTKCVPARLNLTYGEAVDIATLQNATQQPWWSAFKELANTQSTSTTATADDAEMEIADIIIQWDFSPTYLQPGLEVRSLLSAILMGLLAGLILNVMPCVLPVVSLKLSSLLGAAQDEDEKKRFHAFREHNIFFVLGILTFFLVLAVALGTTGNAWGALFQHRWLVLTMAAIMAALGASLFGLFHLPVIDLKFGVETTNPRKQAFFTGMLTTLLATPCSGPFLGGVLGWALIQGPIIIATVFVCIGLGMSTPYLFLALNPKLARFLPKSGPWIEFVEKGIGFFLLGTAFYLVSIAYGMETLRILAPLWVILSGSWLWYRTRKAKHTTRWTVRAGTILLLVASVVWTTPPSLEANPWEQFEPLTLSESIGKHTLFVDFTADWCPTCKVLEATVLTDENVALWKKEYGIRFIKVDMTERDVEAEALLQALGSRSIPTAAIFEKNNPTAPLVLRDLFTVNQVEKILKSL